MMLFTAFVGTGGITLRRFPDPNSRRVAEVRISDEGAMGGSTTVTVFRSALNLPFGSLRRIEGKTNMGWIAPTALEMEWIGENTIEINGEAWSWRE